MMRRWLGLVWLMVAFMLAGCSADKKTAPTPVPLTVTPTAAPETPTPPAAATVPPTLDAVTDPYPNLTTLLDSVCFDYLTGMSGQTWLWITPEELLAFYDQVDSSERCPHAVTRSPFDFNGNALAGVVGTGTGCDAAFRVTGLTQDDAAQTQTLSLQFEILPGCPYDLVEPLLIAIPRPPEGYRLNVSVASP